MARDDYTRFFVKYDLRFRAQRSKGLPLALQEDGKKDDVQHVLESFHKAKKATQEIAKDDIIKLIDVKFITDKGIAVLLLQRSDPRGSTQMYEHRETKKVRLSDRQPLESIAVSTHVFIRLKKSIKAHTTYNMIIEEADGLSRTYILHFLNHLLQHFKYTYNDKNGDNKETFCQCDIIGHASETMQSAMKEGVVRTVTLVKPGELKGLDERNGVPADQTMPIKIRSNENVIERIRGIRKLADEAGWADVRVKIEFPQNKSRTVALQREQDAAHALFVRSLEINLKKPLLSYTNTISKELVEKAVEVFGEKWG